MNMEGQDALCWADRTSDMNRFSMKDHKAEKEERLCRSTNSPLDVGCYICKGERRRKNGGSAYASN